MNTPITRIKKIYNEFPSLFWVVVSVRFIDALGGTLLNPFFALYITQRFKVGMVQAGILLGMSSFFALFGSMIGGALADRFGRRRLIIFGLVFSAVSSLSYGLANDIRLLYPLTVVVGLLSSLAYPAHDALLADILPEEKRQEGFGILRVAFNYAFIFGTAVGGLIAARSFFALFVIDAVVSCVTAFIIYRWLPETKPSVQKKAEHKEESLWKTVTGYGAVLRDLPFLAFILAGMLALLIYQQQYSSLAVFLRDTRGIDSKGYGLILSLTALEVVVFQFWITRLLRRQPPFMTMVWGTAIFALGFFMYGLVHGYLLFLLAALIVCLGEMLFFPASSALAANFAPEDMRGRYMAVFGLIWTIPATIGPAVAGIILDNFDPNLLWYLGGAICLVSAFGYFSLHLRLGAEKRFEPPPEVIETS